LSFQFFLCVCDQEEFPHLAEVLSEAS
jgi:hypothetical protein